VLEVLDMALERRRPESVIHRSDQGWPVHFVCLRQAVRGRRDPSLHELRGRCLRQGHGRVLLRQPRARTPGPTGPPEPGRGTHGRPPVHRRVVQPEALPLDPGIPIPHPLRGRLPGSALGRPRPPGSPGPSFPRRCPCALHPCSAAEPSDSPGGGGQLISGPQFSLVH